MKVRRELFYPLWVRKPAALWSRNTFTFAVDAGVNFQSTGPCSAPSSPPLTSFETSLSTTASLRIIWIVTPSVWVAIEVFLTLGRWGCQKRIWEWRVGVVLPCLRVLTFHFWVSKASQVADLTGCGRRPSLVTVKTYTIPTRNYC